MKYKLIGLFKKFAKPYLGRLILVLLINISIIIVSFINPYIIKQIIDNSIVNKNYDSLYKNVMFFVTFIILSQVLLVSKNILSSVTGERILYEIRLDYFKIVMKKEILFFSNYHSGDLVRRFSEELPEIISLIISIPMNIITQISSFFIGVIVMFNISAKLTLVLLPIIPCFYFTMRYYNPKFNKLNTSIMESYGKINTSLFENIHNIKLIKLIRAYKYINERLGNLLRLSIQRKFDLLYTSLRSGTILSLISSLPNIIIYLLGGYLVIKGDLTLGSIVAISSYASQLFSPVNELSNISAELQRAKAAFNRYIDIIGDIKHVDTKKYKIEKVKEGIFISEVSFSYKENVKVIDNISANLEIGKVIRILGENGSGKTTLIDIICGLLSPTIGSVKYDEYEINLLDKDSLVNIIGIVSQDAYIFNDTIRNNIVMGREVSDEQIIKLSERLNCTDIIIGDICLDMTLSDNGNNLSGGQKQKISILRALINNPQVLILDEVSSFLDVRTKRVLYKYIDEIKEDKIVILISHDEVVGLNPDIVIDLNHQKHVLYM